MMPRGRWRSRRIPEVPHVHRRALLDTVLQHHRLIVIIMFAGIAGFAWAYTLAGVGMSMTAIDMTAMANMGTITMAPARWSPTYAVFVFLMWWIMMIAMMIPSAAPMVLLFVSIARKRQTQAMPYLATCAFLAGYLAVWGLFSAVAAFLHWGLEKSGLLTPMMTTSSGLLDGLLLVAAGLYQLTPLKHACLSHCRQPAKFITWRWPTGTSGALRMGAMHGAYCLGCCWLLMGLLFFGGVMNLYWIAGIASYVLVEKLTPHGHWLHRAAGAALATAGTIILVDSV